MYKERKFRYRKVVCCFGWFLFLDVQGSSSSSLFSFSLFLSLSGLIYYVEKQQCRSLSSLLFLVLSCLVFSSLLFSSSSLLFSSLLFSSLLFSSLLFSSHLFSSLLFSSLLFSSLLFSSPLFSYLLIRRPRK